MMPPWCFVCHKTLRDVEGDRPIDHFTYVYFADYHSEPGVEGSGVGAEWFCAEHAALGEAREHMPYRTALDEIRAATK
ncbi:hypothetical protein [Yinghuangia soli]|uniref:Uncharacterized protein n=1 Tax=Yinghuangia soli TaxID=2908204 RepID=A0AA41PVU9_9ACTN|nr:hypothetical protein [Yinghuangia soli]MCF2526131.1 hypothetical protein [Yinghuangia soli]